MTRPSAPRTLAGKVTLLALSLFFTLTILIIYGSQKFVKVRYETIYIKDLPKDLVGVKLLQISDLHANDPMRINVDIWKHVRNLDFDLSVITGDIINIHENELTPHYEQLKELANRAPAFFVDGNHDRLWINTGLENALEELGISVMHNRSTDIPFGSAVLRIIGLGDAYSQTLEQTLEMFAEAPPQSGIRVVLCHQPQYFDEFKQFQPELTLAGHTHGGQLRLPFMPTLYAPEQGFFPKYGYGLYEYLDAQMFISKGIGHTIFPIRFWNRPELVVFTLEDFNKM